MHKYSKAKVPTALRVKKTKRPVTSRALRQRLNRALRKEGKFIDDYRDRTISVVWKKGKQWQMGVGDAEKLGREMGVLREWEQVKW